MIRVSRALETRQLPQLLKPPLIRFELPPICPSIGIYCLRCKGPETLTVPSTGSLRERLV
eukprot:6078291-Prymnesium_polylepis.1